MKPIAYRAHLELNTLLGLAAFLTAYFFLLLPTLSTLGKPAWYMSAAITAAILLLHLLNDYVIGSFRIYVTVFLIPFFLIPIVSFVSSFLNFWAIGLMSNTYLWAHILIGIYIIATELYENAGLKIRWNRKYMNNAIKELYGVKTLDMKIIINEVRELKPRNMLPIRIIDGIVIAFGFVWLLVKGPPAVAGSYGVDMAAIGYIVSISALLVAILTRQTITSFYLYLRVRRKLLREA